MTTQTATENPTTAALADVRAYLTGRSNGYVAYGSTEAIYQFIFGPQQHDEHARERVRHLFLAAKAAERENSEAALDAFMAESRERIAQDLARTHGYDTAALRHEYDRYATGCFSRDPFGATRRRQFLRALDIAIEYQGAAHQIAAE